MGPGAAHRLHPSFWGVGSGSDCESISANPTIGEDAWLRDAFTWKPQCCGTPSSWKLLIFYLTWWYALLWLILGSAWKKHQQFHVLTFLPKRWLFISWLMLPENVGLFCSPNHFAWECTKPEVWTLILCRYVSFNTLKNNVDKLFSLQKVLRL